MNDMDWLYGLGPSNIVLGLDNIKELLSMLGNPQNSFRTVHVAGSDGKGSVCALMSSVLDTAGIRTGLYTSPHITEFNERISISGRKITDGELSEYAGKVRKYADAMLEKGKRCTFFEVATAIAFVYFKDMDAEYAIVEVGMGGRFDATNVIVPEVSVINHISMEHTEYLGDTIEKIAFEKAGIIKSGVPVVTSNTGKTLKVIEDIASEKKSEVFAMPEFELTGMDERSVCVTIDGQRFRVGMPGSFQASNAALAYGALKRLKCFGRLKGSIEKGFAEVRWPCRLQKIDGVPIILDVSHTDDGSRASFSSVEKLYGKVTAVFGLLSDKDAEGICRNLSSIAQNAVVTVPRSERAMDPKRIAEALGKYMEDVTIVPDFDSAMEKAMEIKGERNILVTGSFYMAEGALKWLKKTSAGF